MGKTKGLPIRGKKKPAARITLKTPYSLDCIFKQLNISKMKKSDIRPNSQLTRKEKNNMKKEQSKEIWGKSICHRQHLVFGMSEALRSLEKNELCALLLCRDVSPSFMMDPFVPLCMTRDVPAAAIPNLGETMKSVLNFKSCKSLGFKRSVAQDPSNVFHEFYKIIQSSAPRLFGTHLDVIAAESSVPIKGPLTRDARDTSTLRPKPPERPADKDYSHLYVKKVDVKSAITRADEFLPLDMSETQAGETSLKADTTNVYLKRAYKDMKIKRVKPSGKIKRKKLLKPAK